jgi:AmmeMemoRadiSam system protein A
MPRSPSRNRPPGSADPAAGATAADTGAVLLAVARAVLVEELLGSAPRTDESHAWLHEQGATFVTLTTRGRLNGCIGTVEPRRTLLADVRGNAYGAAFRDRRFPRLTAGELDHTVIEVSVLSDATPMPVTSEADALARLRPHVDGVVLECGRRRATFLPRVWEHLPEPADFLSRLRLKAGLPALYWSDDVRLSRYTVTEHREGG